MCHDISNVNEYSANSVHATKLAANRFFFLLSLLFLFALHSNSLYIPEPSYKIVNKPIKYYGYVGKISLFIPSFVINHKMFFLFLPHSLSCSLLRSLLHLHKRKIYSYSTSPSRFASNSLAPILSHSYTEHTHKMYIYSTWLYCFRECRQ